MRIPCDLVRITLVVCAFQRATVFWQIPLAVLGITYRTSQRVGGGSRTVSKRSGQ